MPTLLGQDEEQQTRTLYWEFHERGFDQAIRSGKWKVVRKWGEPLELYNLSTDIGESRNVASEHPDLVEMFETKLIEMRTPSIYWPSPIDDKH
ncbi:MAG: hypothetical protein U5K69_07140 [Balneolaceae bacterium]|nr:hypothetical protein [Balneolaceae bacterium]